MDFVPLPCGFYQRTNGVCLYRTRRFERKFPSSASVFAWWRSCAKHLLICSIQRAARESVISYPLVKLLKLDEIEWTHIIFKVSWERPQKNTKSIECSRQAGRQPLNFTILTAKEKSTTTTQTTLGFWFVSMSDELIEKRPTPDGSRRGIVVGSQIPRHRLSWSASCGEKLVSYSNAFRFGRAQRALHSILLPSLQVPNEALTTWEVKCFHVRLAR